MKKIIIVSALLLPLFVACANKNIDNAFISSMAFDIQNYSKENSNTKQVSYRVHLKYPNTAISAKEKENLQKLGWKECSGKVSGWQVYIDSSNKNGSQSTKFRNIQYWNKNGTLATVLMEYSSGIGMNGNRLNKPDNADQHVTILLDRNSGTKEWLGIVCPN